MSWAFITALKKNPQQSYVQLLNSIRDELASKYEQKPQLSCSHPLSKSCFPESFSRYRCGLRDCAVTRITWCFHCVLRTFPCIRLMVWGRYEPAVRDVRASQLGRESRGKSMGNGGKTMSRSCWIFAIPVRCGNLLLALMLQLDLNATCLRNVVECWCLFLLLSNTAGCSQIAW